MAVEEGVQIAPKYKGFLKNQGKVLNISSTPEVVFTTDLIYLRYSLSIALAKSVRNNITIIRNNVNDLSNQKPVIKQTLDRLLPSAHKVFKLNKFHNLIFQGLGDSLRIYELNHTTAFNVDLFMRINLASALILKTFADPLNPDKILFVSSVTKISLQNTVKLRAFFATKFNPLFDKIGAFLEIAELFFKGMMIYVAIKLNMYEDKGLVKRTKDFKVCYVENLSLGKELLKLVAEIEKKTFKVTDQFNIEANRKMAVDFLKKYCFEDANAFDN